MLCTLSGWCAGIDALALFSGLRGLSRGRSMRCQTHGVRSAAHSATCLWQLPCSGGWVGVFVLLSVLPQVLPTSGLMLHDSRSANMLYWHYRDRIQEGSTAGVSWHSHLVEVLSSQQQLTAACGFRK